MTASTASNDWPWIRIIVQTVSVLIIFQYILFPALSQSYGIRLYALKEYGNVIHEFDPYFNFRATVYLDEHGWSKFVRWFDYKSWYPLGRPVGTTIYPGMQITSVLIHKYLLPNWSINDICCFVPAWFGVTATLAVAALTWNCTSGQGQSGSILWDIPVVKQLYQYTVLPLVNAIWKIFTRISLSSWGFPDTLLLTPREHGGTSNSISDTSIVTPLVSASVAAWIMSIVPAHLLRSVGGGYDNESVAMTAMVMTFACWTRSLQASASPRLWGVLTGLAYGYMVAAWGGYTFVLNLIGVHATFLVLLGRFSHKLYLSYSCFYIVGTLVAVQVPVVGWSPIRSLEQVGPLLAFIGIQLMQIVEYLRVKRGIKTAFQLWKLRVLVFGGGAVALVVLAMALYPTGYFGPISSRVRGLFVKHTKTGNPLVDSVAEHQAASPEAYFQYLHYASFLAPIGFLITTFYDWDDASSFLFVYAIAAYFFSHKMVRLILLTAPIASCLAGIAVGRLVGYAYWMMMGAEVNIFALVEGDHERTLAQEERAPDTTLKSIDSAKAKTKKSQKAKKKNATAADTTPPAMYSRIVVVSLLGYLAMKSIPIVEEFRDLCHEMAKQISHPTIIQKAQTRDGRVVVVDDYREAYFWLRDNTPEDARIMAWWDYGYQITGIANRTTIADGNTWNHEHIALLGRTLTAPEKEGHRIARHLADYVLVWAGGGGDDLAKSPHLRRIANSVYRGLCREPTCREFGFTQMGPTKDMRESLLYKLHSHGLVDGVEADRNRFKEVFSSKYGKVRIYKILSVSKESKAWVEDPSNRLCDAPGSWFCRGQYPPALTKILKEKKDFKQLEDFNRKADDEEDSAYQQQYMENLMKPKEQSSEGLPAATRRSFAKLSDVEIEALNENWENNEATTLVWNLISNGAVSELMQLLSEHPELAHIRSEDGRGPMWWAYESKQSAIIKLLRSIGVSEDRTDENGISPKQLRT